MADTSTMTDSEFLRAAIRSLEDKAYAPDLARMSGIADRLEEKPMTVREGDDNGLRTLLFDVREVLSYCEFFFAYSPHTEATFRELGARIDASLGPEYDKVVMG